MERRKALLLNILFLLPGIFISGCGHQREPKLLENENLKLELSDGLPLIRSFTFKQANISLQGDAGSTGWVVNGHLYPWREWHIHSKTSGIENSKSPGIAYQMSLPVLSLSFDYIIELTSDAVLFSVEHIRDSAEKFISLGWGEKPLLHTDDSSMYWWSRQSTIAKPFERKKSENRGLWSWDEFRGRPGDSVSKESGIDACLWEPEIKNKNGQTKPGLVAGLISNTDLFPIRLEGGPGKGFSLGLNTYHYRLMGQVMPDLQARLLLAGDLNNDSLSDVHDYFYWKNRRLPDVPAFIRGSIAYKVFMDAPYLTEPATTLNQLDRIVTAINHVTDGIPQIAYIVGWQYRGHDTGYPSLDKWNERLGPHEKIYERSAWYQDHLNTCLSYHINIDDAFKTSRDFNDSIMATDYDGGPMYWQMLYKSKTDSTFHISHYKDVQSGAIFRRLETFLKTVPVHKILHLDAMRTINCNPDWEKDSLGVAGELDLGLKPIIQWLKRKGIEVTTEGQNGMPHELPGWIAGVYHMDDPTDAELMVYHRKLLGGGRGEGRGRFECGLGTSLHEDLTYRKIDQGISFTRDWNKLKERIFLGSLLYIYYQQRQMQNIKKEADRIRVYYDDGTIADIDTKQDRLLVSRGDIVIARDDDRFIPLDSGIYVFSRNGGEKEWNLPPDFTGKALQVFSLTEKGRENAPAWQISGNRIRILLKADVPVKIMIKSNS